MQHEAKVFVRHVSSEECSSPLKLTTSNISSVSAFWDTKASDTQTYVWFQFLKIFRPVPLQPSTSENLTCKQQANPHSLPECMVTIDQVRQAPFRFLEPSLHWPLCGPLAGHTWCLLYEATLALPVAQRGNGKDGAPADSPHPECQSQIKV